MTRTVSHISTAAYRSAFADWFLCLRQTPHYAEVADDLQPLLVPRLQTLPEGTFAISYLCEIIEFPLLHRVPRFNLLPIWKSNYLWRRIYLGQAHRVIPCPACKGVHGVGLGRSVDHPCCPTCGSVGWLR